MREYLVSAIRVVFILLVVDVVCAALWAWGALKYFEGREFPDVPIAVVLMGNFNDTHDGLGDETQRRLNHAFDLYVQDKVKYVLCVGGARPKLDAYGSEFMRQHLIDSGIPEGNVFLEKESYDSVTNWTTAYKIIKDYGWDQTVIVSSPFHLFRFREVIRGGPKQHLNIYLSPYSIKEARPSITYFELWQRVHYHWAALYARVLPEQTYRRVLHFLRSQ